MGKMKLLKMEFELFNELVVDLVDSYTTCMDIEKINLRFVKTLHQLTHMRKAELIDRECFDEHLIDMLTFYKMVLRESAEEE